MSQQTVVEEIERVPKHLTSVLALCEDWSDRLTNEMDSLTKGRAPNAKIAKQISDLAKNSKAVATELRAWVGKTKQVLKDMSLEDKLSVSRSLIQGLGKGDRLKFYNTLIATEHARTDDGIIMSVVKSGY